MDENLKETALHCLDLGLKALRPDGSFEPFGYVFDAEEGDRMVVYASPEGNSLDHALTSIRALPETATCYVLIRDTYLTIGSGERTPTVMVEVGIRGEAEAVRFGIRYRFDEQAREATPEGNPMYLGRGPHLWPQAISPVSKGKQS